MRTESTACATCIPSDLLASLSDEAHIHSQPEGEDRGARPADRSSPPLGARARRAARAAADQVDAAAAPDAGARGAGARGPLSRRVGVVRTNALRRSRIRRQRADDGAGRTSVVGADPPA